MDVDDDSAASLQVQVTALKALIVTILATLGNRDNSFIRELLSTIPTEISTGAIPLNPVYEATIIEINKILKDFRDEFPVE